jgi:SH3-like domain-containing protein
MNFTIRLSSSAILLTATINFTYSSPVLADYNSCQLRAYVIDKKSDLLNVRSQPNPRSPIVGKLPGNADVQILKTTGDWMLVTPVSPDTQNIEFQGQGWVFKYFIGLGTRGYGKQTVTVFRQANSNSGKAGRIPASRPVKLLNCQGQWALVEKNGVKGWLPSKDQCAAALTSCS